jgi:hypothetical protein
VNISFSRRTLRNGVSLFVRKSAREIYSDSCYFQTLASRETNYEKRSVFLSVFESRTLRIRHWIAASHVNCVLYVSDAATGNLVHGLLSNTATTYTDKSAAGELRGTIMNKIMHSGVILHEMSLHSCVGNEQNTANFMTSILVKNANPNTSGYKSVSELLRQCL